MAEAPRPPRTDDEAPMPRWVYALGLVVVLVAVGFVVMHLAGGGIPSH